MRGERRYRACAEAFGISGEYDPACCRFPKSCSPYPYAEAIAAGYVTDDDLEPVTAASGADHPSHPNQLIAQTLGVCWHPRGTPSFWPCTPLADWEIEWAEQQSTSGADQPGLRYQLAKAAFDGEPDALSYEVIDRLLPLIEADRERAKAEGGAEALEQAGRDLYRLAVVDVPDWLHDQAAALRGSTGGGTA